MTDKKSIRKDILTRRSAWTAANIKNRSERMVEHLHRWLSNTTVRSVFLYTPFRNEPDLTGLIAAYRSVNYMMPVIVEPERMEFYSVNLQTSYTPNRWGILEPDPRDRGTVGVINDDVLIVIPALAADVTGNRLGYGAGFYDRYLENSRAMHMVAVFEDFILPALPHEKHDIKAHFILSEGGVGEC